jgi:parvulin-like peptidyl-prolyl isomerase
MEFVSEEAAGLAAPSDEELTAYLKANAAAFTTEPRATFVQVYLDPRKRAATLDADAKRLLEALNRAGASADVANSGDRLLLLEPRYDNMSQSDMARLFGKDFAAALVRQASGTWVGPIASGYGVHLVRVESLAPGTTPTLEEVRPLVEREWINAKRLELSKSFYDRLRKKYAIKVQTPEPEKP